MRDPERIKRMLSLLEDTWMKVPDWRLTQLVVNTTDTDHNCGPVFYMEDDVFEEKLLELNSSLKEMVERKTS
ncbi:MAG: DUF1040 family protein [Kangiellaceae bacterium]|nr:DUF1040 family protein [Kangiellaceae bacterium]